MSLIYHSQQLTFFQSGIPDKTKSLYFSPINGLIPGKDRLFHAMK